MVKGFLVGALALLTCFTSCSSVRTSIEEMDELRFNRLVHDATMAGDSVGVLVKNELSSEDRVLLSTLLNALAEDIQAGNIVSSHTIRSFLLDMAENLVSNEQSLAQIRIALNIADGLLGEIRLGHPDLTDREKQLVVEVLRSVARGVSS